MNRLFVVGFFAITATQSNALCAPDQIPLFECDTGAKRGELCLTADKSHVIYRFGVPGAPELELIRHPDEIRHTPWNGIGRTIFEEVAIDNGGFTYVLANWVDKLDDTPTQPEASITVMRGELELGRLDCAAGMGAFAFDPLVDAQRGN